MFGPPWATPIPRGFCPRCSQRFDESEGLDHHLRIQCTSTGASSSFMECDGSFQMYTIDQVLLHYEGYYEANASDIVMLTHVPEGNAVMKQGPKNANPYDSVLYCPTWWAGITWLVEYNRQVLLRFCLLSQKALTHVAVIWSSFPDHPLHNQSRKNNDRRLALEAFGYEIESTVKLGHPYYAVKRQFGGVKR